MIFTKKYTVGQMHCDPYSRITIRNLALLMLDTALDQEKIVEKDIDMTNFRWIIYKWDIEFLGEIKEGYDITIQTKLTHTRKFYAYREFSVIKNGEILARARAVNMLIDIERLRPVKISEKLKKAYGTDTISYNPPKVKYQEDLDPIGEIAIRLSDIDYNFHVNNAAYFDIIKEVTEIFDKDIQYIDIVYRNEIRNKKVVLGNMNKNGKEIDFSLTDPKKEKTYCLGKIRTYV